MALAFIVKARALLGLGTHFKELARNLVNGVSVARG
jgi:hypothetical protein